MNERVAEVYSLLVPLAEGRLLVPRTCVAEVVGYQLPTQVLGTPPWYLGLINWNNSSLPLVSFEGACGQSLPLPSTRSRIVVFHTLGERLEMGNYALLAQGFPQLVRVSADMLRADQSYTRSERAPVLCRVRMLKESPLLPDLEQLESMIADETSVRNRLAD
jgi:chemosensory pili system protein ChpC